MPDSKELEFKLVPGIEFIGALVWQAHRAGFVFTIVFHPAMPDFEISIACRADYLPKGPFKTFDQAMEACNQVVNRMEN